MSSNFDFLRNFDNDLHYLACIIESEIYDSPSAVLTDATTFLEIIIYDIFRKNELEIGDLVYFKDKIAHLFERGLLSPELKKQMLKAYSIRNKMHSYNGDAKNHIHLNQLRAVNLHRLLFNVSWLYYSENTQTQFKAAKPSYIHPSKLKNDLLVRSELGNGKCIICEARTSSDDELFCRDCKYKIEKSDNLKTLRKHFGFSRGFRRKDLIDMGFEKGYIGPFLQELKNDNLIYTVGKVNFIDRENTDKYVREAEAMMCVEKVLSDFKLKSLGLADILDHELYLKGRDGEYPYVGFYHLFSEILHSEFLSKINQGSDIEEILKRSYLSLDELDEWYFKSEGREHDIFKKKLVDEIFYYRKKGSKGDFKISENILDDIKLSETYKKREDELTFSEFIKKTFNEKTTRKEAIEAVGLSESDLQELLDRYPEFEEKFEKSYVRRKMGKFLKHYDYYNYEYSLKKNGLTPEEIGEWLKQAGRGELYSCFLEEYRKLTLKKYVEYRKSGNTRHRASKKVNCDAETIKELLDEYDNDLGVYLAGKSAELLESGKTKDETVRIVDVTPEWFSAAVERGMKGEDAYISLYMQYSRNAIPRQMDRFMEMIKARPLKNVLKELNMDEKELDSWCEQGKDSIPPYDEFYREFLEYKKETYVRTMIRTDSRRKALKKSYLSDDEFREFADELETEISCRSLDIVMDELKKGNTTKRASQKASVKIAAIYDWIRKAMNGDDNYSEFLEVYREEYLIPIKRGYAQGVKKGANEKEIIRTLKRHKFLVNDDVKHLKQLDLFPKPGDEVIELDDELEIDWE